MHYIDEGTGPTVLLLHGNPTWSYIYRDVIKDPRNECRLVALDYPGFGMSKAPAQYGFTPQDHSDVVAELIARLELRDFVMVVQDWGGPIGMSCAVRMERWEAYLEINETETLADAGHSVQEDRPDRVAASIRRVLAKTPRI